MIDSKHIEEIAPKYRNPWHLMSQVFAGARLTREDILTIVNSFNKVTTYK